MRQGHLISTILFIQMVEGLSQAIRVSSLSSNWEGIRIANIDFPFAHFSFFNDTLLFGQASIRELRVIKVVIEDYVSSSCQLVNMDKSKIIFVNVSPLVQHRLVRFWCFSIGSFPCKYLGILFLSRSEKHIFEENILSTISNTILIWKQKWLSFTGKILMIKVVLSSIPTYIMSFLKIPRRFSNSL